MTFQVNTTSEMLHLMFDGTAKEGDTCSCQESKGVFVFEANGWTRIKSDDKDFSHIYGDNVEH